MACSLGQIQAAAIADYDDASTAHVLFWAAVAPVGS
jgi:hypothetical protein